MRPVWARLERPGAAKPIWAESRERFSSLVLGPRFEEIARSWVRDFAAPDTIGGIPAQVASGVVNDPRRKATHEIDVVALGPGEHRHKTVLAIGEVKWNKRLGMLDLQRLREIRALLDQRADIDVSATRLLCFSGAGFTDELRRAADTSPSETVLVDLERLYTAE